MSAEPSYKTVLCEQSPDSIKAAMLAECSTGVAVLVSKLDEVLMEDAGELVAVMTFLMPGGVRVRFTAGLELVEE